MNEPVTYRSVSQIKQYLACPYQYKLARRDRAWRRPAAWLPHGTAVHAAAEAWERSGRTMSLEDAQAVFRRVYMEETNRYLDETPNADVWSASGPYRGQQDISRRYGIGLDQVAKYIRYYQEHPDETVWETPDGPAIELKVSAEIGGVEMLGYIDQVVSAPPVIPKPKSRSKRALAEYQEMVLGADLELRVRDIKTGAEPGDAWQLKVYAVLLKVLYDVSISRGDYWMAKAGKPAKVCDLDSIPLKDVEETIVKADRGIRAEEFPARPGDVCARCPVATACAFRKS